MTTNPDSQKPSTDFQHMVVQRNIDLTNLNIEALRQLAKADATIAALREALEWALDRTVATGQVWNEYRDRHDAARALLRDEPKEGKP